MIIISVSLLGAGRSRQSGFSARRRKAHEKGHILYDVMDVKYTELAKDGVRKQTDRCQGV